jgi:hypothetical protein
MKHPLMSFTKVPCFVLALQKSIYESDCLIPKRKRHCQSLFSGAGPAGLAAARFPEASVAKWPRQWREIVRFEQASAITQRR